jgi:RNA polymerase sigma-70 factor (ECF subfamily)
MPLVHSFIESLVEPVQPRRQTEPSAGSGSIGESTQDLLELARRGDQPALARLYARYLTPLRHWARGRLPGWARDLRDTEDVVQEAIVQTFRRLDAFDHRGPGALHGYLRQAVINRVRDECRRVNRRPGVVPLDPAAEAFGPSPLEEAVGAEAVARYDAALARLPLADREGIVARVEMGCSYQEIAEMLEKPSADAARVAVSRALVRLAEEMKHER